MLALPSYCSKGRDLSQPETGVESGVGLFFFSLSSCVCVGGGGLASGELTHYSLTKDLSKLPKETIPMQIPKSQDISVCLVLL